jgi:putative sigma-54 modulation protein
MVKGKNLHVTPALKEHAEKRLVRLSRYFDHIDEALVTQSIERNWQIVDVTLKAGGLLLRSEQKSDDMYSSIDMAAEHLERQLKKFKGRLYARGRHHANREAVPTPTAEEPTEIAEDNGRLADIVKVKRFALKPMSTEEAVLQLELLGHNFFVFINAETEQTNVLYRRNDGQLGLIEPVPA